MPKLLLKIIPASILWGIFILIILKVPYPDNLAQANLTQIGIFFIVFYLALAFTINIIIGNFFSSSSVALGAVLLLVLKSLDSLNAVTAALVIIAVGFFVSYFRKIKRKNLTKLPKIPKLTRFRKREK